MGRKARAFGDPVQVRPFPRLDQDQPATVVAQGQVVGVERHVETDDERAVRRSLVRREDDDLHILAGAAGGAEAAQDQLVGERLGAGARAAVDGDASRGLAAGQEGGEGRGLVPADDDGVIDGPGLDGRRRFLLFDLGRDRRDLQRAPNVPLDVVVYGIRTL